MTRPRLRVVHVGVSRCRA